MKAGKEPMRTFGDLLQFYQHKTVGPEDHPPPAVEQAPAAEPAPAAQHEAPAMKDESPVVREEAPAVREEAPPANQEPPAGREPQAVVAGPAVAENPESV